jgi:hypothetical protein
MFRFWTVNLTPVFTENTPTLFPPLIVITLPPSMVVSDAILLVPVPPAPGLMSMVTRPPPQSNATSPPPVSAVFSAASVQLAALPVPTTPAAKAPGGGLSDSYTNPTSRATNSRRVRTAHHLGSRWALPSPVGRNGNIPTSCVITDLFCVFPRVSGRTVGVPWRLARCPVGLSCPAGELRTCPVLRMAGRIQATRRAIVKGNHEICVVLR